MSKVKYNIEVSKTFLKVFDRRVEELRIDMPQLTVEQARERYKALWNGFPIELHIDHFGILRELENRFPDFHIEGVTRKTHTINIGGMKKTIREQIFSKHFKGDHADVRFLDLPIDIQPNDIIHIKRDEGHYSENESWEPFTELIVIREREETDVEYEKRIAENAKIKEELRQHRYENYLKLKAEFEQE